MRQYGIEIQTLLERFVEAACFAGLEPDEEERLDNIVFELEGIVENMEARQEV